MRQSLLLVILIMLSTMVYALPDLVISNASVDPDTVAECGSTFILYTITNNSDDNAGLSTTKFYIHYTTGLDSLIGSQTVNALAAHESVQCNQQVIIPPFWTGIFPLLIHLDADNSIAESFENNNNAAMNVTICLAVPWADLDVLFPSAIPNSITQGGSTTIDYTVSNYGGTPAAPTVTKFYLSDDNLYDVNDILLGDSQPIPALGIGESVLCSMVVTIPASVTTGLWNIIICVDADNIINEVFENDNIVHVPVTVTATGIGDLVDNSEISKLTVYPNPVYETTFFTFKLSEHANVSMNIYNLKGQLVKQLTDKTLNKGKHTISWNGTDESGNKAAAGVYFCRIQTNKGIAHRKFIKIK